MAKLEKFEDMDIWQDAITLAKDVYAVTRNGDFARDFGLANQLQRSAVSVSSNIAEGFERNNTGEFMYFLRVAKASCGEVRTQLVIAHSIGYTTKDAHTSLYTQAVSISKRISGYIRYLKERKTKT